jgi:CBS domain-containing protein
MTVRDIMTPQPRVCWRDDPLSAVAVAMWDANCGIVPVVDNEGKLTGVITDRDICMALTFLGRPATEVAVCEVVTRDRVLTCQPEDDLGTALAAMREQQLRRLPVVDQEGHLLGLLSITDAILACAREGVESTPLTQEVVRTLAAVCAPLPLAKQAA